MPVLPSTPLSLGESAERMGAYMDQESLRRTLSILDQLTRSLRGRIAPPSPQLPSTPVMGDSGMQDVEAPPSLTNSQSTNADSENLVQESITCEVDVKKNLPSPAATDDVNGSAQLEEKPKDLDPRVVDPPGLKTEPPSSPAAIPMDDEASGPVTAAKKAASGHGADAMDLD